MQANQDLFEKNLSFYKASQPALYQRLRDHTPLSEIVYDEDGDPDILFERMRLYNTGATKFVEKQMDRFWRQPDRVQINPISSANIDDFGSAQLYRILKYADENDITFAQNRNTDKAFHLFFLGVGLGAHILPMIERVKPRNVLVIEPNFEFLYQSMFTFDWQGLATDLKKENASIHIIVEQSTETVISEMRNLFREYGPVSFDGLTVYRHYDNPLMTAVMKYLKDHGDMLYTGLGFFEDELNIIANTYLNLKSGKERVFYADTSPKQFPVFVVGSGPSLDNAIDTIRENQDRAVIISCGSGLTPLVRNGVTPDFHMELERSTYQIAMPKVAAEHCDFSKLWLIASTTVLGGTRDLFPNRAFFFRHMLSCFPMFSKDMHNCLRHPSPTVGNTGLSFAQDMGFREIYLYGLDLGFKDAGQHHSKSSPYEDVADVFDHSWDREAMGNFGGHVKTVYAMDWAKDSIEQSMKLSDQGFLYYNCSDGAMIRGAVPLLPELVDLPEPKMPKAEFIEKLIKSFPVYTQETLDSHWVDGKLIDDINAIGEAMCTAIDEHPNLPDKRYVTELTRLCDPHSTDDPAIMVIRGSLYHIIVAMEYYLDRVMDGDKLDGFVAEVRDALKSGIRHMCSVAEHEFTHLQEHGSLDEWAG